SADLQVEPARDGQQPVPHRSDLEHRRLALEVSATRLPAPALLPARANDELAELALRLLHGRSSSLRLRERPRLHRDRSRLRRNRDLFARGGIATGARLRRGAHPYLELDEGSDLHLLGFAELLEHDFLERGEDALDVCTGGVGAIGDLVRELRLGQGHSKPPSESWLGAY